MASPGEAVSAGQVVARLDGAEQAAQLLLAQADLRAAEAALAEAQATAAGGEGPGEAGAAAALDAARAAVDQAQARIEAAAVRSDRTVLRAPFAGRVASVGARPFESVAPGAPIVRLADDSGWLVITDDLEEQYIASVQPGAPVTITLPALPGVVLAGRVVQTGTTGRLHLGDVVFPVVVRLLEDDPRLRWNMSAEVAIEPAGTADR